MKITGIYKITSPTNKIYIGQAVDVLRRFSFYKKLHCKSQTAIYRSLLKHGSCNHTFEIIEECKEDELTPREKYWIQHYNTFDSEHGLNLKEPGKSGRLSKTTVDKIRKANTGRVMPQEQKDKISKSNTGKIRTAQGLLNLSKAHLGNKLKKESVDKRTLSRVGYKHSEETKEKTRISVTKSWEKRRQKYLK